MIPDVMVRLPGNGSGDLPSIRGRSGIYGETEGPMSGSDAKLLDPAVEGVTALPRFALWDNLRTQNVEAMSHRDGAGQTICLSFDNGPTSRRRDEQLDQLAIGRQAVNDRYQPADIEQCSRQHGSWRAGRLAERDRGRQQRKDQDLPDHRVTSLCCEAAILEMIPL